jgi:CRP/FNR family transcriptional regulator, nitrogen fixation regulation protein
MLTQTTQTALTQNRIRPIAAVQPGKTGDRPAAGGHALEALDLMGSPMAYGHNEEIYGEEEPAEFVYKVVSGAVRTCKILTDGRRQIGAFFLPGDIFGLEVGKDHQFSAEAIGTTVVRVVRRRAVVSMAERDCDAARELWTHTARELHRVQDHMLVLVKSAQQRLACFLLEMSDRLAASDALDLPMSRQDIADYLGLTIETVSRTMSQLVSDSAIGLPTSRRIVLRSRSALHTLNA